LGVARDRERGGCSGTGTNTVGNISGIRHSEQTGTTQNQECFRYDDRQRLTAAWSVPSGNGCALNQTGTKNYTASYGGVTQSKMVYGTGTPSGPEVYSKTYAYDAAGNMQTLETSSAQQGGSVEPGNIAYPAQGLNSVRPHAPSSSALGTYTYNANGSMTQRAIESATGKRQCLYWSPENRLESMTATVTTACTGTTLVAGADGDRYRYDTNGQRIIRSTKTGTTTKTTLYLDGLSEITQTTTGGGTTTAYTEGFETGVGGWSPWSANATNTQTATTARPGGTKSLQVTTVNGGPGNARFYPPATPGVATTVSIWTKGTGTVQPHIQYFTSAWGSLGSATVPAFAINTTGPSNGFTQWTFTYTPPPTTGIIQMAFVNSNVNPWYIDDATITTGSSTTTTDITKYYTAGGATIASRKNGVVTWLLGDIQGGIAVSVPNNTTDPVQRQRYLPYGARRGTTTQGQPGTNPNDNITSTERGFLGQTEDTTGLDYLNNRYHDPTLGNFISVDPLVAVTRSAYAYGSNNPISRSDPSGLCDGCGSLNDTRGVDNTHIPFNPNSWSGETGGPSVHGPSTSGGRAANSALDTCSALYGMGHCSHPNALGSERSADRFLAALHALRLLRPSQFGYMELGPNALGNRYSTGVMTIGGQEFMVFMTSHAGVAEVIAEFADGVGNIAGIIGTLSAAVAMFPPAAPAATIIGAGAGAVELAAGGVSAFANLVHDGDGSDFLTRLGVAGADWGLGKFVGGSMPSGANAVFEFNTNLTGSLITGSLGGSSVPLPPGGGSTLMVGTFPTGDGREVGTFAMMRVG
jgi:RHS repeat-associated protein